MTETLFPRPLPPDTPVLTQITHSGLGEIMGFAVSIGAVYIAELAMPKQTHAFVARLAEKIGEWRGTSATAQHLLARQITDVTLMNLGGATNMAAQFALRRHAIAPENRPPLASEFGRILSGRVAGTVTAIGALALAETHAPNWMDKGQRSIAARLGGGAPGQRFGELLMSNLVQSAGGVAGNVPAQLLYDRLVSPAIDKKR